MSYEERLESILKSVVDKYPGVHYEYSITEQYRNMKDVLDQHPQVAEYAVEAIKRAGMEPILSSIRGGTDGSRLSFMGLPCPNIFAGGHNFHGKFEYIPTPSMAKACEVIVKIVEKVGLMTK